MRSVIRSLVVFTLGIFLAQSTFAQGKPTVDLGVRLGTDIGGDIDDEFLGIDVRVGVPTLPIVINPAFDFYFMPSNVDFWQLSANALLAVNTAALPTISPYVGAGLGISRISVSAETPFGNFGGGDTDIGLNLVGGGAITVGSVKPFAQLQLTIGNPDLVTIAIGAHVKVSG